MRLYKTASSVPLKPQFSAQVQVSWRWVIGDVGHGDGLAWAVRWQWPSSALQAWDRSPPGSGVNSMED